tara:strand:- start:2650 stop:2886 length:237 start_codon:yes stop_codon:yes gene_type:complete
MPDADNTMKYQTNVERITEYMEFGSPMNQVFLINAINVMSEKVIADKKKLQISMKDHIISPDAWIACAEEWMKTVKKH